MKQRDLTIMQIRAEVMMVIQRLLAFEDPPKSEQDKCILALRSITDRSQVLRILLKELLKTDYQKGKIISFLLIRIGSLEELKDPLWSYIKNPNISDTVKDLSGIILRSLGDNSNPDVFLSYLENPEELIDKETEKLLETAIINPDALIDFLDFLFALPEEEQVNLVTSIKYDFSGEHIANVLTATLEANPNDKIKETCIEMMGEVKSQIPVPVLLEVEKSCPNESLQKLARKSLNMLKLSGVNINSGLDIRGAEICKTTNVHECYVSLLDGIGNQGLIFSRIQNNRNIIMFSVILNDQDGIIDCFGFYGISEDDFSQIIDRFQQESTRIQVNPEYCKYLLCKAEAVSKCRNSKIPYEYIAWKCLMYDINTPEIPVEKVALEWGDIDTISQSEILYKHPDFKYWFMEKHDHPALREMIDNIIETVILKREDILENPPNFLNYLEDKVTFLLKSIFDKNWKKIYQYRLLNVAYLFECQKLNNFKKMASSLAIGLADNSPVAIEKMPFFREFMRKTISEAMVKYSNELEEQRKLEEAKKPEEIDVIRKKYSKITQLDAIINILYKDWQRA